MSYIGKLFVLDSQEKFEEFMDSFGDQLPAALKKASLAHKATAKLVSAGSGQMSLITSQPTGGEKTTTFKSGVEFDDDLNGHKAKTTITLDGSTLTTVMKFDNGITFNIIREFSDNQLIAYVKSSTTDIVAKRTYKAA